MKKRMIIRGRRVKRFEKLKKFLMFFIVFGIVFGMGSMALFIGFQDAQGAYRSKSWPWVQGVVIQSEIKISSDRVSSDTRQGSLTYQAEIKYEYFVDKSFLGDRVSFGEVTNKRIAEKTVKKYKTGREVKVYYDPSNPENSVLEPGFSLGMLLWPALGLVVIGCGFIGIFVVHKYFWEL